MYQRELVEFANGMGKLNPPNEIPTFEETLTPAMQELTSGWVNPSPLLFEDDADYSLDRDPMVKEGIKSPQEIAEIQYRRAIQRYQLLKGGKVYLGSDCASDGGVSMDLLA
eukprot:Protomagalhaensia_wolfi_Nauph_80__1362@NODE_1813_length_1324_cov_229_217899_g1415_i0_p2_GENE_NODE_1813_length_1324_cov_229_217899_g1415_i0NODE_1813_length_1324_cov_229_217899_g1415_i0_p2_ORF_typecomplete_len111_score23_86_NODE_1813_length_1324_cov_229_217899_g1415_i0534866